MKISNNIKAQGGVTDDTSLCGKFNGHLLEILGNINNRHGPFFRAWKSTVITVVWSVDMNFRW